MTTPAPDFNNDFNNDFASTIIQPIVPSTEINWAGVVIRRDDSVKEPYRGSW